ncbi:hypothetical protein GCM10020295_20660 [Streptomyces cinereospinus]
MNAIITATELADDLAGPNPPVLLDVRWQLSVAKAAGEPPFDGRAEYAAGHIPGAVFVDLDRELASAPGAHGRHPLPDLAEFGAAMRRAGVSPGRRVVVYDGGQGWAAARAWWLLRWTGHPDVRVLDGGLPAWEGALSQVEPTPEEGDFRPVAGAEGLLDAAAAAALARSGVLLDARAAERYRGTWSRSTGWAGTSRARCPHRRTRTWGADGRFLPAEQLRARFDALGGAQRGEGGRVLRFRGLRGARGARAGGRGGSGGAVRRLVVGVVVGPVTPGRRGAGSAVGRGIGPQQAPCRPAAAGRGAGPAAGRAPTRRARTGPSAALGAGSTTGMAPLWATARRPAPDGQTRAFAVVPPFG